MWMNLLLLIGGLALILIGANGLTDGAASVAKRFRISDLVIGLTIVAFGTSASELVISVLSSLQGSAEMAIGNVVGSNIFNVLMIIGCTALVLPIQVGQGTMSKEIRWSFFLHWYSPALPTTAYSTEEAGTSSAG